MIGQLLAKVIGTQNEREIKRLRPRVVEINVLEPTVQSLTDEQLRESEDRAIADVVGLQQDAGLQTVTDGEFRRTSWHMDFIYRIQGIRRTDEKIEVHFHNASGDLDFTSAGLVVDAPVRIEEPIT